MTKIWIISLLIALPLSAFPSTDFQLIESVKNGDTEAVREILQTPVDVNIATADGTTALHWAALRNNLKIADLLIGADADVNSGNVYGVTPLWIACMNRSGDMTEKLLAAGGDMVAALLTGETVLMKCARTGAAKAVALLLAAGADVEARESSKGQNALMWAAAGGHSEVVRLLIEHGANIASTTIESAYKRTLHSCRECDWVPLPGEFTPLLFAVRSGDLATVRLLIEAGADPNEASPEHGNSLVIASASGYEDIALYLLENGADPHVASDTGITSLHHAVGRGLASVNGVLYDGLYRVLPDNMHRLAKALLEAGVDPDARIQKLHELGPDGTAFDMVAATPFLLAAASADIPLMHMLREYGADTEITTVDGITPLMAATYVACSSACMYQGGNVAKKDDIELSLQTVKAVIEMGTDVNATNRRGLTAMHIAAFGGSDDVVEYLASAGAQVDVRNNNGETPWSMASGFSPTFQQAGLYGVHESTATLLLKLGATPISKEEVQRPGYFDD